MTAGSGRGARRLGTEVMVIVLGVLVALTVDTAWNARGDVAREAEYLSQLEGELVITHSSLEEALAQEARRMRRSDAFLAALDDGAGEMADSLGVWWDDMTRSSLYSPTLATPGTLVATGDLQLVRDSELRTAVVRIEQATGVYQRTADLSDEMLIRATERLGSKLDRRGLDFTSGVPSRAYRPDWDLLAEDLEFRNDAYQLRNAAWNRHLALTELTTVLAETREALAGARGG